MADRTTTPETLLVCNCQKTMSIDGAALAKALQRSTPLTVHSELCRAQLAAFETPLATGRPMMVACTQEAPLFRELAEERGAETPISFVNIRERAGWSADGAPATPRMAALIAEAALASRPAREITINSDGTCVVYGRGQQALEAAQALSGRLSITLLLIDAEDVLPPSVVDVPIVKGRIRRAEGHLGAFKIEVDGYAPMLPSSKAGLEFVMPRDRAQADCDIILDISGETPLFADSQRRDGYLRADPRDPAAVARAMLAATDLVGEFEKPVYVAYDADICAHARSGIVGCSNCLSVCPTGAISPDGDHVEVSAAICGGCGSCSAACPTGAVSYDYPSRSDLARRIQVLIATYREAGGKRPVLLVHDEMHGAPLIAAMARYGRGLPANILPIAVFSVFQIGHDIMAAALAAGAEQIVVLAPADAPHERPALDAQAEIVGALLDGLGFAGPRVTVASEADPDAIEELLYGLVERPAIAPKSIAISGGKRDIARTAISALHAASPAPVDTVSLPKGAPYGRIQIATDGCTLCLACVGACPTGALGDNPERPQVAFTEAACVQCGVCAATCPERVMTLEARYVFGASALTPVELNGEEPFCCVKCGKPFGAKSTIERITERLKSHSIFADADQLRLIQMCGTCRVVTLAETGKDPMTLGERPRVRTTDDYLAAEAAAKKTGKTPDDFLD